MNFFIPREPSKQDFPCHLLTVNDAGQVQHIKLQKGDWNRLDGQIYSEESTMLNRGVQTNTSMYGVQTIDGCTCFDYKNEESASYSKCSNSPTIGLTLCILWLYLQHINKMTRYTSQKKVHKTVQTGEETSPDFSYDHQLHLSKPNNCAPGNFGSQKSKNISPISSLTLTISSVWILFKLSSAARETEVTRGQVTRIEFVPINHQRGLATAAHSQRVFICPRPEPTTNRLQYTGVDSITFRSSTPFLIQLCGCRSLLKATIVAGSGYGAVRKRACKVVCHKPGEWIIHFLRAGVNQLSSGRMVHLQVEPCLEEQAEFIYMPAERCTGRNGFVVARVKSEARGNLNGQPMLKPMELSTGDKLVLYNSDWSTTCTMYFFNLITS